MIFGKTYNEQAEYEQQRKLYWKDWFAWYPVLLNDGRTVLLHTVQRRVKYILNGRDHWEYRLEPKK